MFAETNRIKRNAKRLLLVLVFLLILAGILTYFIISRMSVSNERNGVFVYSTIQKADNT